MKVPPYTNVKFPLILGLSFLLFWVCTSVRFQHLRRFEQNRKGSLYINVRFPEKGKRKVPLKEISSLKKKKRESFGRPVR